MKNLKMAYKLCIGFGIVVLLSAFMAFSGWLGVRFAAENATAVAEIYIPIIDHVTIMERETLQTIQYVRAYTTSKNDADYATAMKHAEGVQKSLNDLIAQNTKYPNIENLQRLVKEFPPLFATYLDLSQKTQASILLTRKGEEVMVASAEAAAEAFSTMQQILHNLLVESFVPYGFDVEGATRRVSLFLDLFAANSLYGEIRRMYVKASSTSDLTVFAALHESLDKLNFFLDDINKGLVAPEAKKAIADVRKAMGTYSDSFTDIEEAWKTQTTVVTERLRVSEELISLTATLSSDMVDTTQTIAQLTATEADTRAATLITTAWIILLISVIIAVFLTKIITTPLHKGVSFAKTVAGGNLDGKLEVYAKDELGQLADALRSMVESLKAKIQEANEKSLQAEKMGKEATEAMQVARQAQSAAENAKREGMLAAAGQLEGVITVVGSASTQLSAQLEQSERGSTEQAQRVAETATAMEEMNSTVMEVARNASSAAGISSQTREKAEQGARVVQEVVFSIQEVQRHSLELKEDMALLGEHAKSINEIMGVISDIADQTNMLALNAAIEAARAGEAGRGFAVVADEVRNLAEKTMQSTINVGNTIRAIQQSTGKSIQQVDFTVQNIEKATELANSSGTVLTEIVHMADNTADQVRAIATASEEQSASSEEINRSITQINTIAIETARAMQEASHAVGELVNQAQVVGNLIEEMKNS